MQIFIKLPNGKTAVYTPETGSKVIDLKRFVLQKMRDDYGGYISNMLIYSMHPHYYKFLRDHYVIEEFVSNNSTIEMTIKSSKYLKNNKTQSFLIHIDLEGYGNLDDILVYCAPEDNIEYLLNYVLEELYSIKKHHLTSNDVSISYKGNVLESNKLFAEYNTISKSFVQFTTKDGVFNNLVTVGEILNKFSNFHHCIPIGERNDQLPHLIISKNENHTISAVDYKCKLCEKYYDMLFPCCREKVCFSCANKMVKYAECILCEKRF